MKKARELEEKYLKIVFDLQEEEITGVDHRNITSRIFEEEMKLYT